MSKISYLLIAVVMVTLLLVGAFGCAKPEPPPAPATTVSPAAPKPAPTPAPKPTQVRFLSASVGSENYGLHSYWMGELVKKWNIPSGAFPGGPEFNIPIVARGDAEFSYTGPIFADAAYNGKPPFGKAMTNLRFVSGLGAVANACLVRADSKIKSVADLNGKKVGVGKKGSGSEQGALLQMKELGITPETIQKAGGMIAHMDQKDQGDAIGDGTLDAAWTNHSLRTVAPSYMMVETRFGIRLVKMPDDAINRILAREPYVTKGYIEGGVYKGEPEPVCYVSDAWGFVTRAELPEDFVYEFLKVVYSDTVAKETRIRAPMYGKFGDTDVGLLSANIIPMHAGAAKFFRERGVDLAARGIQVK